MIKIISEDKEKKNYLYLSIKLHYWNILDFYDQKANYKSNEFIKKNLLKNTKNVKDYFA